MNTKDKYDWLRALKYNVTTAINVTTVQDSTGDIIMSFDEHKMSLKANGEFHELTNWRKLPLDAFIKIIAAFDLVPEKLHEAHAIHLTNHLS